jgi:hypothetical protein
MTPSTQNLASSLTLTLSQLKELSPCKVAFNRISLFLKDEPMNIQQARAAGATLDDIIWVCCRLAKNNEELLCCFKLWLLDCAAHVLPIHEQKCSDDDRPRNAIIIGRSHIFRKTSDEDLLKINSAANEARNAARNVYQSTTKAARLAAISVSWAVSWPIFWEEWECSQSSHCSSQFSNQ